MAVLNARLEGEGKDGDGNPVSVPPGEGLQILGPGVQVALYPLEPRTASISGPIPTPAAPVVGQALIDTGAGATCVDRTMAENTGLPLLDTGPMTSATHDREIVPIFACQFEIGGFPHRFNAPRAYGANLESQGLIALIGRDLLASCVLVYNGLDGSFSLSI